MKVKRPSLRSLLPRFRTRSCGLHGDRSLLDAYLQQQPSDFVEWITVAWCWDNYPLPDGSLNPTSRSRRQPGVNGHLTVAPPVDGINDALNRIIKPVLQKTDAWVLTIPRSIGYTHSLDAKALFSDQGGAALMLPMGIFGMVYVVNEIVAELRAGAGSRLPQEEISFIRNNYPGILAYLLLQEGPSDGDIPLFVMRLDKLRYERNADERSTIWSFSVAQQLYMVLHEFGHLLHGRPTSRDVITQGVSEHRFCGKEQEIQADTWAAKQLHRGCTSSDNWPHWKPAQIALLTLFGAMDLLRENRFLENANRDELALRLATLLSTSEKPGRTEQISTSLGREMLSLGKEILWGEG